MSPLPVDQADVAAAAQRIRPYVVETPMLHNERLARETGVGLQLKAESLQHVGAFKARGATNAVLCLTDVQAERGVVTHSSGNHGAALARAAALRKIPAYIVMPRDSARTKIEAVRSYGVEPVFCEPNAAARSEQAAALVAETGAHLVHPYDDPDVIAGQGTVAMEILQQVEHVDVIVVPVGGGGLLSGVLTVVKALRPEVEVVAAEPELADDAYRSLQSGRIEMPQRYDTIADGLRSPLGKHAFAVMNRLLDDIVLVSESAIRRSMQILAQQAHLVVEPSGAVATAAVLEDASRFAGRSVVTILSGGNLDPGATA